MNTITHLKPSELSRDQWVYKGWQISFDMPPIPARNFDWAAFSPDYDVDQGEDGLPCVVSGQMVHAATYEELIEQIELAILDSADEAA